MHLSRASLALTVALSAIVAPAAAQEPVDQARAAFREGVAHAQASRWEEAEAAFRRALDLHAAPTIRYNLAAALVEQGHLREAHGQLLSVEADPALEDDLRRLVGELRERMHGLGGRVAVRRASEIADATVVLDQEPVDEAWLAGDIPVAPGAHRVEARRAGELLTGVDVRLAAGDRTVVALSASERVIHAVDEGADEGAREGDGDGDALAIGLGIGGGVLVVAAVVTIVAVVLSSGGQGVVDGDFGPPVLRFP